MDSYNRVAIIKQPRWKSPLYSKSKIDRAGEIMCLPTSSSEEKESAIQIIDNWRASHAYPLQVFYMKLRRLKGDRKDIVVAQRIKRLSSIVYNLSENPGMKLSRMQDLGGCRMIVPTINDVYYFSNEIKASHIRHDFKRDFDYINTPKSSGYRSLHLVYKFRSESPSKQAYNNMLIELQFRTRLQHVWATALETMAIFTKQALKAGHGSKDYLRFFVLVSSLFAIEEKKPVVPGTIDDEAELISEIEIINDRVHILDTLEGIRLAINHDAEDPKDKRGYYLLTLKYDEKAVVVRYYMPSETEQANTDYNTIEGNSTASEDSVLVRASSMAEVRAAYPNYFLDINEFVERIETYLRN